MDEKDTIRFRHIKKCLEKEIRGAIESRHAVSPDRNPGNKEQRRDSRLSEAYES